MDKYTDMELIDFASKHALKVWRDMGVWCCEFRELPMIYRHDNLRDALTAALDAHRRASITDKERLDKVLKTYTLWGITDQENPREAIDRHILAAREEAKNAREC